MGANKVRVYNLIIFKAGKLLLAAFFSLISLTAYAEVPIVVDTILACDTVKAKFTDSKSDIVRKIMAFSSSVNGGTQEQKSDVYVKWLIHTENRNSIMRLIPILYVISKEHPDYIKEYYGTVWFNDAKAREKIDRASDGTIPIKNDAMLPIIELYTPDIYSKTFFKNNVLSPFNKTNAKFYRYKITEVTDSTSRIIFKPRVKNTQFVKGEAVIDKASGKVLRTNFAGEYDMFKFNIDLDMSESIPVLPVRSDLTVTFSFMNNKLQASIFCLFLPPKDFSDSVSTQYSLDSLRPCQLTEVDKAIYARHDSLQNVKPARMKDKIENKIYKKAWNTAQQALVNSFTTDLGAKDNLSVKFSPLLNPSYLNYSHSKGLSYRYDIRGKYLIDDNSDFHFLVRMGYMFSKKQFFFDAPFSYAFDVARHGTIGFTVGNGNRITNSSVREMLIKMNPDSVRFKNLDMKYYTDNYYKLHATYDLTDWFSAEVCATYHRRSPVDKKEFEDAGQPTAYKTFAPSLELTFKPLKEKGPVLTLDYERGIKGVMKSGIEYEKFEGDLSWIKNFSNVSSLSMRVGGGLYTDKSQDIYFLDYSNFRENNLPGGWNDDWSGEFQLLNPAWYNVSKYYYRSNMTYEQPMIISYLIPFFSEMIEKERFYVNFLLTDSIHPYTEYGYAFTNRLFSLGIYLSTRNWKYQALGFRFSVELFGRWK